MIINRTPNVGKDIGQQLQFPSFPDRIDMKEDDWWYLPFAPVMTHPGIDLIEMHTYVNQKHMLIC
jgi:hypothetical protein